MIKNVISIFFATKTLSHKNFTKLCESWCFGAFVAGYQL